MFCFLRYITIDIVTIKCYNVIKSIYKGVQNGNQNNLTQFVEEQIERFNIDDNPKLSIK